MVPVADTQVAELASLLEIDAAEARSALEEAKGDLGFAVEVVRSRSCAATGPSRSQSGNLEVKAETIQIALETRCEWKGGCSILTVDFEHKLKGREPGIRERWRDGEMPHELHALAKGAPRRDSGPLLCDASRIRAQRQLIAAQAAKPLGLLHDRSMTNVSFESVSADGSFLSSSPAKQQEASGSGAASDDEQPGAREAAILENTARLMERLAKLGLHATQTADDGNCLFRACSAQLYDGMDSAEYHMLVRHHAVAQIKQYEQRYSVFFEGEAEFTDYLAAMAEPKTWGDELVLRAVADAYGATVHVVTSAPEHWYLAYSPELKADTSPSGRHIFLTYVSPVHYSGFEAKPLDHADIHVHVRSPAKA